MKKVFLQMKFLLIAFPILVTAFLSGCGGSSADAPTSAVTISGTAAAGAPVVGYVSVRDSSSKPQPVKTNIPIEANGNYSVDVTGLTPPYAFLATGTVGGKTVSLYSAATSADNGKTINITPFTDLIIRNIAGGAVDTYFSNPANMANLTTAELDAKRVTLTEQLRPALEAMGLSGSIDLLRASFNADSSGLDRFMDVVKVDTTTPSAVTITNILDAANQLTIDTSTGIQSGNLSTAGLDPVATPLDKIVATFKDFSAYFATSLPAPDNAGLVALFSNTFMSGGVASSAFLTDITSGGTSMIGLKFTNVVVDSIDTTTGTAKVHFTPVNAAGEKVVNDQPGGAVAWEMKLNTTSGLWLLNGDQRLANISVMAYAHKQTCNPATTCANTATTYSTGLHLRVENRGTMAIGSALVTGPGLPQGGVVLAAQQNQTWFNITTSNPASPCTTGCTSENWDMLDADIANIQPNSTYTVQLYSTSTPSGTALATYTEIVPAAPQTSTAVATMAYPSLTGLVNLAGVGAATLTPSWAIPAGLNGDWIDVYVSQATTNESQSIGANARTAAGTASLVITAPSSGTWSWGGYWISARDQYGREVSTGYNQQ